MEAHMGRLRKAQENVMQKEVIFLNGAQGWFVSSTENIKKQRTTFSASLVELGSSARCFSFWSLVQTTDFCRARQWQPVLLRYRAESLPGLELS